MITFVKASTSQASKRAKPKRYYDDRACTSSSKYVVEAILCKTQY